MILAFAAVVGNTKSAALIEINVLQRPLNKEDFMIKRL